MGLCYQLDSRPRCNRSSWLADLVGSNAGAALGTELALKLVAYVAIERIVGGFAHRLVRKHLLICLDLVHLGLVGLLLPFAVDRLPDRSFMLAGRLPLGGESLLLGGIKGRTSQSKSKI